MAVIQQIITRIDAAAASIGPAVYETTAGSLITTVRLMAIIGVAMVGVNFVTQVRESGWKESLWFAVKIMLVFIFLGSYANFNAVFSAITNAPAEFAGVILQGLGTGLTDQTNVYAGLDVIYLRSLDLGNTIAKEGSWVAGALTAVLLFLLSAIMTVIAIILITAAKIMTGVLLMLAPFAIAATLLRQTAFLFEGWLKLAIGFALVPLVTAAMAGFTIYVFVELAGDIGSAETIGDVMPMVIVLLLGSGLMLMVNTVCQSLTGAALGLNTAVMGAGGAALSAGKLAKDTAFGRNGKQGALGKLGVAGEAQMAKVQENLNKAGGGNIPPASKTAIDLINKQR